ncbi:MAG: hypothetical protein ACKO46_03925 [Alphaproteobacteria bacterium]
MHNLSKNSKNNTSNLRVFGSIWALIFLVISYKYNWNIFPVILFTFFAFFSVVNPKFFEYSKLMPLWIKFGDIIGKINSKIIIFIMFYALFVPIGLLLKIFGKDILSKKLKPNDSSYFKPRVHPSTDMKNQF